MFCAFGAAAHFVPPFFVTEHFELDATLLQAFAFLVCCPLAGVFWASWDKAAIGDAKANMNAVKSLFIIFVFLLCGFSYTIRNNLNLAKRFSTCR